MPENLIVAPARYSKYPGDPDCVYRALCYTLSERVGEVDWDAFTAADWKILTAMAETEGVAPLMFWKFDASPEQKGKVPQPVIEALQTSYYRTLARNTLLFDEMDRILTAFGEAGIPVILLKGAALAQSLYEDIGLRPMGDIDLMVAPEDVEISASILYKTGYTGQFLNPHIIFWNDEVNYDQYIELHWGALVGRGNIYWLEFNLFINNSSTANLHFSNEYSDISGITLNPTILFFYLALHLAKHEHRRLVWCYDVYEFLKTSIIDIDWNWISSLVNQYKVRTDLLQTLGFILSLFNAPELSFILNHLRSSLDERRDNQISGFNKSEFIPKALMVLPRNIRWKVFLKSIFPSPMYIHKTYNPNPSWLWIFYVPLRWLNLLKIIP